MVTPLLIIEQFSLNEISADQITQNTMRDEYISIETLILTYIVYQ